MKKKMIGIVAATVSMLLASGAFHFVKSQDKPNVLLILADDLGSIDLNCYGSKDLATPNLDRLAKSGVRFTQFYAGAPVCSPSRASLLTGKSNLAAGMPGNVPVPEKDPGLQGGMPSSEVTIAEMLKANGYYTALVGKWHLGHAQDKLPNAQGFDYFFGHQRGCIDNYSHYFFWDGPNKHDLYRNDVEINREGEYFPDMMVEEIGNIIDDDKEGKPFFIYWAANVPHYPYQGTAKWREHYRNTDTPRKEYAAFVSTLDERIGMVLDKLGEKGILEKTLIIFQSDHGHSYEERAFFGGGNSGPYRGGKFSLFEGGIRVPAIISYPNVIAGGQVRDQVTSGMDWFPTIAEITRSGYDIGRVEGKSLLPVIRNENAETRHTELHWQVGAYDDQSAGWAVRKGEWKLLGNPRDPDPGLKDRLTGEDFKGKDRLFLVHLPTDIGEKRNLANEKPEVVRELLDLHRKWLAKVKR